jgi:hypothetical protein
MPSKERQRRGKTDDGGTRDPWFGLGPLNFALFGAALVAIVVGYWFLDRGSVTAAPVLLVLGYAVLFPAGLLLGRGGEENRGSAPRR